MFGPLGFQEVLLLLLLALLLFGPRQLPEMGRKLGRGLSQLRRTSQELKQTLDRELLDEGRAGRPHPVRQNPLSVPRGRWSAEPPAGGQPQPQDPAAGSDEKGGEDPGSPSS